MSSYETKAFTDRGALTRAGYYPPEQAERVVPEWWHDAKRCIDLVLATGALLCALPLLAGASLAIVLVSPGSPFFAQERVGHGGRRFRMFKLRTMICGAHLQHAELKPYSDVSGPVFKMRNDPRLHPLGRFLRRWSIDELPNLINVLRGEMSIVGPRPALPSEVEHYDAFALRRLRVKPGITCLWQVSGRSRISFEEWMRLDDRYVEEWSPWSDLAIVARTLPAVLSGDGAH
ncbi:MAG TPA: sugar transferase [Candidatus Acidoferrales bacterium]|nr:sugar transferase [Candidatus Acidoferrales bacterium]